MARIAARAPACRHNAVTVAGVLSWRSRWYAVVDRCWRHPMLPDVLLEVGLVAMVAAFAYMVVAAMGLPLSK
jgi:hypothetical protein